MNIHKLIAMLAILTLCLTQERVSCSPNQVAPQVNYPQQPQQYGYGQPYFPRPHTITNITQHESNNVGFSGAINGSTVQVKNGGGNGDMNAVKNEANVNENAQAGNGHFPAPIHHHHRPAQQGYSPQYGYPGHGGPHHQHRPTQQGYSPQCGYPGHGGLHHQHRPIQQGYFPQGRPKIMNIQKTVSNNTAFTGSINGSTVQVKSGGGKGNMNATQATTTVNKTPILHPHSIGNSKNKRD